MTVDILLSTYNSVKHLEELLDSLVAQSFTDWQLIVRDDGSSDNTLSILNKFSEANKAKITIIDNYKQNLGPKRSFEKLLEYSSAEYIMFCDHDDYWLPDKVQDSLNQIKELEKQHPNKPALVFTDLKVVDQSLYEIHPSFWKYSKLDPNNIFNTCKLLINNPAPGCTFLFNKAAKALALPFPDEAIMHDWWIALRISEDGVAAFCEKPSILYRQHSSNKIGAESVSKSYFKNRILRLSNTIKENRRTYRMMKRLKKKYSVHKLIYYKISISLSKLV